MTISKNTNATTAIKITEQSAHIDETNTIKAIEFELALGAEDLRANGFENCVNNAAESAGFLSLFNLPSLPEQLGQRLAAVAAIHNSRPVYVFVSLDNTGEHATVQPDLSTVPHIKDFAEAYFDLMICPDSSREMIAD